LGHANPFVLVPHFLQVMFIPTMSCGWCFSCLYYQNCYHQNAHYNCN